jgi:O-acetyl-ADP-ribose deacetylase (regulator of RNase III)
MELAQRKGATSITLPSISTGVYGYPMAAAAEIALRTVAAGLAEPIERATFVLFGREAFDVHHNVLKTLELGD